MRLAEAIDALERGLRLEAAGTAYNMPKTQALWGGGHTLHAIGAVAPGAGLVGTKTWAHTGGGATPLLLLWDCESGRLRAVIEAFALGQMRTGAMTGVATKWMAAADADTLAVVGTGKQALTQVAAVHAARPLGRLRIYSPRAESRAAFADKVRAAFDFAVEDCTSVAAATEGAAIVTLVTRARAPFLAAEHLSTGAHLNAVGAISPEREEFHQDVFVRAGAVAVDKLDSVRRLSREFMTYYDRGPGEWAEVRPISALIAGGFARDAAMDVTLFKAMGMGISDLALGTDLLRRAEAAGAGRPLPHPEKALPRLS
jgi:ornithine cyclodeaminase